MMTYDLAADYNTVEYHEIASCYLVQKLWEG